MKLETRNIRCYAEIGKWIRCCLVLLLLRFIYSSKSEKSSENPLEWFLYKTEIIIDRMKLMHNREKLNICIFNIKRKLWRIIPNNYFGIVRASCSCMLIADGCSLCCTRRVRWYPSIAERQRRRFSKSNENHNHNYSFRYFHYPNQHRLRTASSSSALGLTQFRIMC